MKLDMAKYRIKTFRGYSYKSTYESALQAAKDMILDIIVDGHPVKEWWAVINREDDGEHVATIHAPRVGQWYIVKALRDFQK